MNEWLAASLSRIHQNPSAQTTNISCVRGGKLRGEYEVYAKIYCNVIDLQSRALAQLKYKKRDRESEMERGVEREREKNACKTKLLQKEQLDEAKAK